MMFPATGGIFHSYISFCLSPLLSSCTKFEDSLLKRKLKVLLVCKSLREDYTQKSLTSLGSYTEFSEMNCRIGI